MRVFEVQHVSSSMRPLSVAFLINASDSSTFLSVCRMELRWANARQGLGDRLFSGRSKPSRWRRRRRRERSGLQGLSRWQMMSRRCMGDRRAEGAEVDAVFSISSKRSLTSELTLPWYGVETAPVTNVESSTLLQTSPPAFLVGLLTRMTRRCLSPTTAGRLNCERNLHWGSWQVTVA